MIFNNKEQAFELNRRGIELKKQGDYDGALAHYEEAKLFDPINKNCYLNCAKIYTALGNEKAFENLLIFKHLDFIQSNQANFDIAQKTDFATMYLYSDFIDTERTVPPTRAIDIMNSNVGYKLLGFDINTMFNAGFNIMQHDLSLLQHHEIEDTLIHNYRKKLLGIDFTGRSLRESKFEPLVNTVGFIVMANNLKFDKQYAPEEIVEIYAM